MNTTDRFREKLCAIASEQYPKAKLKKLSRELMRAFLDEGSETPDNLNCAEHIEFGWIHNRSFGPMHICGLKLKGKDILVSDVVHLIEDEEITQSIQEQYPELTLEEWSAVTRITTMVLIALEQDK